jgi:hypothetical protein
VASVGALFHSFAQPIRAKIAMSEIVYFIVIAPLIKL